MSVNILYLSSLSYMSPMAMPATGALMGTPPSMSARIDAQIDAWEVEPFEAIDSETILMVYGKSATEGSTMERAFSASAPCPTSRRLVNPERPVSPAEYGGKLEW